MSLTLQYIIVGMILAAVAVGIVRKIFKLRKQERFDSCCGCALSESCNKNRNKQDCHEQN